MVTNTLTSVLVVALAGFFGSVVGAGGMVYRVRYSQNEETKRWYHDSLLNHRIDAIVDLHNKLVRTNKIVMKHSQLETDRIEEVEQGEEIIEAYLDFQEAANRARIFLDSETLDPIWDFNNTMLEMTKRSEDHTFTPKNVDVSTEAMEDFLNDFDRTSAVLREELNDPLTEVSPPN